MSLSHQLTKSPAYLHFPFSPSHLAYSLVRWLEIFLHKAEFRRWIPEKLNSSEPPSLRSYPLTFHPLNFVDLVPIFYSYQLSTPVPHPQKVRSSHLEKATFMYSQLWSWSPSYLLPPPTAQMNIISFLSTILYLPKKNPRLQEILVLTLGGNIVRKLKII